MRAIVLDQFGGLDSLAIKEMIPHGPDRDLTVAEAQPAAGS
jgi:hypothetical protein